MPLLPVIIDEKTVNITVKYDEKDKLFYVKVNGTHVGTWSYIGGTIETIRKEIEDRMGHLGE